MIYPAGMYFCSMISYIWPELHCYPLKAIEKECVCPKHSLSEDWVLNTFVLSNILQLAGSSPKPKGHQDQDISLMFDLFCSYCLPQANCRLWGLKTFVLMAFGLLECLGRQIDNGQTVWQRRKQWKRERNGVGNVPTESLDFKKHFLVLFSQAEPFTFKWLIYYYYAGFCDGWELDMVTYPFLNSILYFCV